ncbi:type II secretion system protein [Candidatus Wolfebacteria bacterium]|nr:type II secretion system protein [Candidatus Wolfebacteria bacterium]
MNIFLNKKNRSSNVVGFTTVELLVAMAIFVVLMSVATVSFVRALRAQRAIIALMEANDNASSALEQMAREMRSGTGFPGNSGEDVQFTNAKGEIVSYHLTADSAIERGIVDPASGAVNYKKITADNIKIGSFKISLMGNNVFPPRITISFSISVNNKYLEGFKTNIQTTVSARNIDI